MASSHAITFSPFGTSSVAGERTTASGTSSSIKLNVVFPSEFNPIVRETLTQFSVWIGDPQLDDPVDGFIFQEDNTDLEVSGEYTESEFSGVAENFLAESLDDDQAELERLLIQEQQEQEQSIQNSTTTTDDTSYSDSSSSIGSDGTSTVSGQIVAAQPGFNVSISQGVTSAFAINYGNSETLTITATTATAGTINFKVSVNGGTATDISGCSAVTISAGAAVCPWVNPTVGKVRITISLTPTNANEAVDPKTIDTIVVAKPFITSFQIRGQSGVTSGAPGSVVVITGGNFTGITDIKFGSVSAEKTFRASATQATVTVPFGATTGPITITTLLGGSGVSATNFTVTG